MKKKNQKQKKNKKKSWLSVLSIFMVCILCFGAVAAFLPTSAQGSSGKGQGSIIDNNTDVPDIEEPSPDEPTPEEPQEPEEPLTREEIITALANKIPTVPENGTLLNQVTFSEIVSSDEEEIATTPGYYHRDGIRYGSISTLNNCLEFTAGESGTENKSANIGFFMDSEQMGIYPYNCYLTIDFDLWTNSRYVKEMMFYFAAHDDSSREEHPYLKMLCPEGEDYVRFKSSSPSNLLDYYVYDLTQPLHITFVCKLNESGVSDTRIYVNGEYITSEVNNFELDYLTYFEMYFYPRADVDNNGASVCIDNVQVIQFKNGNESYTGPISELYNDTSITLDKCADSVLYEN